MCTLLQRHAALPTTRSRATRIAHAALLATTRGARWACTRHAQNSGWRFVRGDYRLPTSLRFAGSFQTVSRFRDLYAGMTRQLPPPHPTMAPTEKNACAQQDSLLPLYCHTAFLHSAYAAERFCHAFHRDVYRRTPIWLVHLCDAFPHLPFPRYAPTPRAAARCSTAPLRTCRAA